MRWPHRLSLLLAASTLILIYVGGLVTSTHSGLAVPDWPLSYGRFFPPLVGGILFEHSHRMVATAVGFITLVSAFVFIFKEPRGWVRNAVWAALALVILQGVLGGLTVLFRLPWLISSAHATLAQTFFSLTIALCVWTSEFWKNPQPERPDPKNNFPLHHIAIALTASIFIQLVFGALVRHTGHLFSYHLVGAIIVAILIGWIHLRVWSHHYSFPIIRKISTLLVSGIFLQLALGMISFLLLVSRVGSLSKPMTAAFITSAHVVLGAALLGLSVALSLVAFKTKTAAIKQTKTKLSDYVELTKPGISFMAGITALAGYVLGSKGEINYFQLAHTIIGTLMIAAGAGTLNMLIEKETDARMKRTQRRPIPAGRLKPGEALFMGAFLSVLAIVYLSLMVNPLTALIAGLTLSIYLYIYTPLKKITYLCTVVGAVAGALPPVIGWAAATNGVGMQAWILFGIIFFWQFPHFFSLAWVYRDDYELGGLHMLPARPGKKPDGNRTALGMVINSTGLLIVSVLPTFLGLTGFFYLLAASALSVWMLTYSILFFSDHSIKNARKIFYASLAYVPTLVIFMVLNLA